MTVNAWLRDDYFYLISIFKLNLLNKANIFPLADIPVVLASAPEADLLLSRSLQIFEVNPLKMSKYRPDQMHTIFSKSAQQTNNSKI